MELQRASAQHARLLSELNRKMIQDSGHMNGLDAEGIYQRMLDWLTSGEYQAHFIVKDGQRIGYCLSRHGSPHAHLRQFYIEPSYRRGGLGTQTVQQLLQGHLRDALIILLDVHPGNTAAMAFWRANGFEGVPENMQYLRRTI